MSDTQPTIWEIEPHTLAKHAILQRYLGAWFPILASQSAAVQARYGARTRRVLYIDGFAGPGRYTGGEWGSPLLALREASGHDRKFPVPVELIFIEKDHERFVELSTLVDAERSAANQSGNVADVQALEGDCDVELNRLLDQQGIQFGPALAFLDQFGYGSVAMELVARILQIPQCEVFSYLNYDHMNRFITDPHKAPALTRAFGGDEWRECIDLPERERRQRLLELYIAALKTKGGAKYVTSFLMLDQHHMPLYWLLFCTNHISGLYEMKRAMWSVDKSGGFRFSDGDDPRQTRLLNDSFDEQWLADELSDRLGRRTMTVKQVREFVLVETPCYLHKPALRILESGDLLKVVDAPAGRRPGYYPDDNLKVRFEKRLL